MDIKFNKPLFIGNEKSYVQMALASGKICGNGEFSKKCQDWFTSKTNTIGTLLTPSCTASLEMSAILLDIKYGDEVIMPSYTFVSTANAFVLRGAKIVFVDIRPDNLNIDENLIQDAINEKTKAIVVVHYAGVGCDMDKIMQISKDYEIPVVEDAAQGVMSKYKDRHLGSIADIGAYSFHETKNYTSGGEGGLLLINNEKYLERAEIIREKGTNRSNFLKGAVDKYSWVDIGSSYLPSELQAAYLWGQLEHVEMVNCTRLKAWQYYYEKLKQLENLNHITLPIISKHCEHNAHMFFIKVNNTSLRDKLIEHLKNKKINAAFHYLPLHSSEAGKKYGIFHGDDKFTTECSMQIIRLPMYYKISKKEQDCVISSLTKFFLA